MAAAPATTAAAESVKSGGGGGGGGGSSSGGGGPSPAAADAYIGSLISLTSKSDIRYQGFLFHINPQESIVGLSNVKSFGTEGRKKDGPQILSNDQVYEYIYFRGSDIKDLQVLSSPPVQSKLAVPSDPAIIQSHFLHSTSASTGLVASGAAQFTNCNTSAPTSLMASGAAQAANFNTSSPTVLMASVAAQVTNFNANIPMGFPASSFPGNLPPYQYRGGSGSFPPPPNQNVNGLAMPIYQPGFTGSTGAAFYLQPHPMPPLPQVLAVSPSVQPQMRHPNVDASLASSTSNSSELTRPLLPSLTIDFSKTTSNIVLPANLPSDFGRAASLASSSSLNLMPNANVSVALPNMAVSASLPLAPSSTTSLNATAVKTPSADIPKSILGSPVPQQNICLSMPSLVWASNESFSEAQAASLLKPGQVLQPGFEVPPNSLQTAHKDIDTVQASASNSLSLDSEVGPGPSEQLRSEMAELKGTALPSNHSVNHRELETGIGRNGSSSRTHHNNRSRSRGRGNWPNGAGLHSHHSYRSHIPGREKGLHGAALSPHHYQSSHYRESLDGLHGATPHTDRYDRSYEWGRGTKVSPTLTKFSEDFDFEAMNDKFNKEEVWGLLGKGRKLEVEDVGEDTNESDENDVDNETVDVVPKHDTKPVYVKDDFFDSLSPNLPDCESGKGKMRHSEQMKLDAETFGEFRRPRRGRGTRWPHWGRVSRAYNGGRGLGNGGRGHGREDGRGHGRAVWSRVT